MSSMRISSLPKKVFLFTSVLLFLIAGSKAMSLEPMVTLQGKNMSVEVQENPFTLRVTGRDGQELVSSTGAVRFTKVTSQHTWRFVLWWFWNRGLQRPWQKADQVVAMRESPGELDLDLGQREAGPPLVRVRARFLDDKTLRVEMEVLDRPDINRLKISFKKDDRDLYFGMGERYNAVEHSGSKVRVWCEEGGLGLFTLSNYIKNIPFNPFPRGPDTTYYPVPFYLNPEKGYGFLLDDVHYSEFDFGSVNPQKLTIENWNNRFDFVIFQGSTPLDVIETMTRHTGRITVPPPWVFAPMNAVVESEERVLEVAGLLRDEGIPTSAIWSESWWWRTEWEVNRELYPNYERMIQNLHAQGFRHLCYYQPYITVGTDAYLEGDEKGYFTKDQRGVTYPFKLGLWNKVQIDLTNPEARDWWKQSFFARSESMGADGWMHDFGEHTPPDSISYDGRSGWALHNEYPLLWLKMGSGFWREARPNGDYLIYVRAGYTGAQKYAPVMWTGDQNTNFDMVDGLPANLPAITSVGISGHPIGTTDIAGFNCFVSRDTDRELFMRWTELGALLPVMRIHRGQDEFCDNWSFDQDRETLLHYKKYAILHTSLFPYIYTLVHQAAERGWPVVRHMMLEFPDDPEALRLDYQYMLGDRLLVAPVLERGARERNLYFPKGEWVHYWSGKIYRGPGYQTVPAPIGEIPLFQKSGTILPTFDSQIDTLVKEDHDDLNGWDDANGSIKVMFAGAGEDQYILWDGTRIKCKKPETGNGLCMVINDSIKRAYKFEFR